MLATSESIRIFYPTAIVVLLFRGKPIAERVFEKKKKNNVGQVRVAWRSWHNTKQARLGARERLLSPQWIYSTVCTLECHFLAMRL